VRSTLSLITSTSSGRSDVRACLSKQQYQASHTFDHLFITGTPQSDKTGTRLKLLGDTMANSHKDSSIQAFFHPTLSSSSPTKQPSSSSIGDGFTSEELQEALKPTPIEPWQPKVEYLECEIRDLYPGPRAVTFMGRVANIFDVANAPKTPRSAKGCVKLCVKDDHDAVTVRLWYADHCPRVRLGSLVSVWTNHSWSSLELTICSYLLTARSLKRRARQYVQRICATFRFTVP